MMNIIIQKYGGTSIGTVEKIHLAAKQIHFQKSCGNAVVVVVSAMGNTTNNLIEMANKISRNPSRRELAMLLSTGEQISISLLSMALHELGDSAISMTGLQCGIHTNFQYNEAKIYKIKSNRILKHLTENNIVVIAGFQGVANNVEITTLGRGGSDTTAAALAAALKAERCEIYTDVDGIYTADPNKITGAIKLDYISYEEILELAGSGAQVIHPRAVEICRKFNLPLIIKSAHSAGSGTTVMEKSMLEQVLVTGISVEKDVAKIAIKSIPDRPGIAAKVLESLAKDNIQVRLIIQSISHEKVNDVTIIVKQDDMPDGVKLLEGLSLRLKAGGVIFDANIAEVSIVGSGIMSTPFVAAKMFKTLAKNKINIELISSSQIRIACIINKKEAPNAMQALHKAFELDKIKRRLK